MLNIKFIYQSILDKHIKLMRLISWVIILFFYFLISIYMVVLSPKTPENLSFIASLNSLGFYLYVILLFLSIFVILFPYISIGKPFKNFLSNNQMFFIKYFPTLPMFISSIGFAVIFIGVLLKNLQIAEIGQILFLIGLILYIFMLFSKVDFEKQIYYSINEAHNILITIDKNNSYQVNKFTKFFKMTLDNLNIKLGRKLKIDTSELGIFHVDAILCDYLPYYIMLGDENHRESLKKHLKTMSSSVDKNNYVDLKVFNDELIQLSKDIINFLKDNNLKIVPRVSILDYFKDIDKIKNIGTIIFYLIMTLLIIVYYYQNGKLPEAIIK